jgi:hypothetical protein
MLYDRYWPKADIRTSPFKFKNMNRLIILGIMLLSFAIAWLLYALGYIFSPMAQAVVITDEPLGLERASGGAIQKDYIVWASAISISSLMLVILASVISASLYFFTPMCC